MHILKKMVTGFLAFFVLIGCSTPSKTVKSLSSDTNDESIDLEKDAWYTKESVNTESTPGSVKPNALESSDIQNKDIVGASGSSTEDSTQEMQPIEESPIEIFVFDEKNYTSKKAAKIIGRLISAQNTIRYKGGFLQPKRGTIYGEDRDGGTFVIGFSDVQKTLNAAKMSDVKTNEYSAYYYSYNNYKNEGDLRPVSGTLKSIRKNGENHLTLIGDIDVGLDTEDPQKNRYSVSVGIMENSRSTLYESPVVIDENNIAKSGKISVTYQHAGNKKKFDLKNLNQDDKDFVNNLGLFTVK